MGVVADDRGCTLLPGHNSEGGEVWPHLDVRESRLGAADGQPIDEPLLNVPAEYHVALGKAAASTAFQEVLCQEALPAEDAVHVGPANFYDLNASLGHQLFDL